MDVNTVHSINLELKPKVQSWKDPTMHEADS